MRTRVRRVFCFMGEIMINVRNKDDLEIKLPLHEKWQRREEGGERFVCIFDADLRDADLRGADLSGADLSGARIPVATICKWSVSVTQKEISIGCKTKTTAAWREFFKNKEQYETESESVEYELIYLAFQQAEIAQKMLNLRSLSTSRD